jgi:hypothetical protein
VAPSILQNQSGGIIHTDQSEEKANLENNDVKVPNWAIRLSEHSTLPRDLSS